MFLIYFEKKSIKLVYNINAASRTYACTRTRARKLTDWQRPSDRIALKDDRFIDGVLSTIQRPTTMSIEPEAMPWGWPELNTTARWPNMGHGMDMQREWATWLAKLINMSARNTLFPSEL